MRVLVIGDSISIGYTSFVSALLYGRAEVEHNPVNGGDSENVRSHLDEWALQQPWDLIHINCGLHDVKRISETNAIQQPLDAYESNLRNIFSRLRDQFGDRIFWATSTPVIEDRHQATHDFVRLDQDVIAYNKVSLRVAAEYCIPVNDLYAVVSNAGVEELLSEDGIHLTPDGYEMLAHAVVGAMGF